MTSGADFVYFLELVILAGSALAGLKLWGTGLFRRYRALFSFLIFRFLYGSISLLWFSDIRSARYQKFWVVTEPFFWLMYVLLVLELYSLVLEKHKGLSTLGRWFLYSGLSISILVSGLALLPNVQTGRAQRSIILSYYYAIERGVDCSLLIFLILLLLWLTRYPVPLTRNLIVHSVVYSTMFLSNTVGLFARVLFGFQLSRPVSTFLLGVFAVCTLVWLIFMNTKGEQVRMSIPRFGPEDEKRILNQLDALNSTLLKVSRR